MRESNDFEFYLRRFLTCHWPIFLYGDLVMKTTLDLPDELLIEAKAVAARRRTTLKAMVEHALRREIAPVVQLETDSPFEMNELGMLVLKRREGGGITLEQIDAIQQEMDRDDLERAINPLGR